MQCCIEHDKIGTMYSIHSHIFAEPKASLTQCVNYLLPRLKLENGYTDYDVSRVILPGYFVVAQSIGVDPVVAIAQMCHETGHLSSWWCARPRRNPAGIGVTGATRAYEPTRGVWAQQGGLWREGVSFATWQLAISAHVGRLAAYASSADYPLVLNALAVRGLPARYRGIAPTVAGLGGTWAVPGRSYAVALVRIANSIARTKA